MSNPCEDWYGELKLVYGHRILIFQYSRCTEDGKDWIFQTLQQVLEPYRDELNLDMKKQLEEEGLENKIDKSFDLFKDMDVLSFTGAKIMNGFNFKLIHALEHVNLKMKEPIHL